MRHDSTKCEMNLLHEIQEQKSRNAHSQPKHKYLKKRHVTNKQYHVAWKVFPTTKRQLTCKFIVNNNADNINEFTTLNSLQNTQNWLKVYHNSSHPCRTALSTICTPLFHGKMYSDWFHGVEIVQVRCRHGEELGYW